MIQVDFSFIVAFFLSFVCEACVLVLAASDVLCCVKSLKVTDVWVLAEVLSRNPFRIINQTNYVTFILSSFYNIDVLS